VHQALIHKTVKEDEYLENDQPLRPSDDKSDIVVPRRDLSARSISNASSAEEQATHNGASVERADDDQPGQVQSENETNNTQEDMEEDDPLHPSCAICLKNYVVTDKICWSKNPECSHYFHCACVELWLLRNDNCPFCRKPYLETGESDDSDDRQAGSTEDEPSVPWAPPLRSDEMENLERGTTAERHHLSNADFADMIAGIERLYRHAHNRLFMENSLGMGMQFMGPPGTTGRPYHPAGLSGIGNSLQSPMTYPLSTTRGPFGLASNVSSVSNMESSVLGDHPVRQSENESNPATVPENDESRTTEEDGTLTTVVDGEDTNENGTGSVTS
jgi:hypothetical protein